MTLRGVSKHARKGGRGFSSPVPRTRPRVSHMIERSPRSPCWADGSCPTPVRCYLAGTCERVSIDNTVKKG